MLWDNLSQVSETKPESERIEQGADTLRRLLQSRGLSVSRLSALTEPRGAVSPSSIRAYLGKEYLPKAGTAINLAVVFGPDDGKALLDAWGFDAAADAWPEIVLDLYTPEMLSVNFRPDVILTDDQGRTTVVELKSTGARGGSVVKAQLKAWPDFDGVPSASFTTQEDADGKVWQVVRFDGPALTDADQLIMLTLVRRLQGLTEED